MSYLVEIFSRDASTYYDVRTGKKGSVWKRFSLMVLFGLVGSAFFKFGDEALTALLTIYSIMIGFAFTAQFYLVDKNFKTIKNSDFIEDKILLEKINKLSQELYSNISYLSVICFVALIVTFAVSLRAPDFIVDLLNAAGVLGVYQALGMFLTILAFCEVIASFWRTSVRTQYLFEKVRGL